MCSYRIKNTYIKTNRNVVKLLMPKLETCLMNNITTFIQGDLRKLKSTL